MIKRTLAYKWLFLIAVPLIALAVMGSTYFLLQYSFSHLDSQATPIHLEEQLDGLNSVVWLAVAEKRLSPQTVDEYNGFKSHMEPALDGSYEMHFGKELSGRISRQLGVYINTTDEMFRLISEGRFEPARTVGVEQADPLFQELVKTFHESINSHRQTAKQQTFIAFAGASVATMASISLVILLFWLFERQRRAADISQAENKVLGESEERFRSVAQSATDAIISINSQASITFWNRAAETVFGYKTGEVMGKPLTFIMPERFRDAHRAGVKRVVDTGKSKIIGEAIEVAGLRRDGSEFPLEMALSRWESREGVFFTAICRDITGRKQAEEQANRHRAELEEKNRELAALHQEAKKLSLHDSLTGLANRNLMNIELPGNMARSRRTENPFSLIMMDLDHFKDYNDTFGHIAGDRLLVEIAGILLEGVRESDLVVRYGGEEILIILPDTDSGTATLIAERLRKKIMDTDFLPANGQPPAHMTVSMGVAACRPGITDTDELIRAADEALYRAKEKGRNRVETQPPAPV